MALLYKMRAIAQSDSSYVFWTDSEPDLTGTNAPEAVVIDSIVIDSVGGTPTGGSTVNTIALPLGANWSSPQTAPAALAYTRVVSSGDTFWIGSGQWFSVPKNDLTNITSEGLGGANLSADFPTYCWAIAVIDDTIYYYGGRANSTDSVYSNGYATNWIHTAPLSDPMSISKSVDTMPVDKAWATAVCNDSYVYVIGGGSGSGGGTEQSSILRAPLSDPTNMSSVGTLSGLGGITFPQLYRADDTVYCIGGGSSDSTPLIYSASYSDMSSWSSTSVDFPYYNGGSDIVICGNYVLNIGGTPTGQENTSLYYARLDDPTNWKEAPNTFTTASSGGCMLVTDSGAVYHFLRYSAAFQAEYLYATNFDQVVSDAYDMNPLWVGTT